MALTIRAQTFVCIIRFIQVGRNNQAQTLLIAGHFH